jgi:hypothetical protein
MALRLHFQHSLSNHRGYFIIDGNRMTIGYVVQENEDTLEESSEGLRDKFARAIVQHVYPDLTEPTINEMNMTNDRRHREVAFDNDYDHQTRVCHISIEFNGPVDFKTLWLILVNIPPLILSECMDITCVPGMLAIAMDYFTDSIKDEELTYLPIVEGKEESYDSSYLLLLSQMLVKSNEYDENVTLNEESQTQENTKEEVEAKVDESEIAEENEKEVMQAVKQEEPKVRSIFGFYY